MKKTVTVGMSATRYQFILNLPKVFQVLEKLAIARKGKERVGLIYVSQDDEFLYAVYEIDCPDFVNVHSYILSASKGMKTIFHVEDGEKNYIIEEGVIWWSGTV